VYYSAHIFLGATEEMMKLSETCHKNIEHDQVNHIQAKIDDESHLNKYFTENPPTSILSRAFLFAEAKIYEDVPTNLDMRYSHLQYIKNEIYAIVITVDYKQNISAIAITVDHKQNISAIAITVDHKQNISAIAITVDHKHV
jgi:hypothetical protein